MRNSSAKVVIIFEKIKPDDLSGNFYLISSTLRFTNLFSASPFSSRSLTTPSQSTGQQPCYLSPYSSSNLILLFVQIGNLSYYARSSDLYHEESPRLSYPYSTRLVLPVSFFSLLDLKLIGSNWSTHFLFLVLWDCVLNL